LHQSLLGLTVVAQAGEEEELIFDDRTANAAPEVIDDQETARLSVSISDPTVGIQDFAAVVLK
jgi:hypothetical protein